MQITLYKNFKKRINSTKQPTGGTAVEVKLKNNTSVESPVFIIDGVDLDVNYAYGFGHYYFINDIVLITNNIYELHCSQDVLATYKSDIVGSTQYVLRSASSHDGRIVDTMYPTMEGCTTSFAVGDWSAGTDKSYIVGVLNNRNSGLCRGGVHYYKMTESQMLTLNAFMLGGSYIEEESYMLPVEVIKYLINPAKYLISCKVFPVDINAVDSDPVVFGGWGAEFSASQPAKTTIINNTITIPKHPQVETYGEYVKLPPYSRYSLHIPCFGTFTLDAGVMTDAETLTIFISIDTVTGMGHLTVSDDNSHTYMEVTTEVAASIGMTQMQSPIAGATQLAISTIGNGLSANIAGLAGNVTSATDALSPQINLVSGNGSISNFTGFPELQAEFYSVVPRDDERNGRPLCQSVLLSTLTGYTVCKNPSISIDGLGNDKTAIEGYMSSGFYIE